MKKIILLLFLCSCGKSAIDGSVSNSTSALTAPLTIAQRCQQKCSSQYDYCMKYLNATDPYETRVAVTQNCELQYKTKCGNHCSWCDSVEWDSSKPELIPHQQNTCGPSNHGVQTCTNYQDSYKICTEADFVNF